MSSLDAPTINILLAGAVFSLFIAFIIILMKLKPVTKTKETPQPPIEDKTQKPVQPSPSVLSVPTAHTLQQNTQPTPSVTPATPATPATPSTPANLGAPRLAEKTPVAVVPVASTIKGFTVQTTQKTITPTLNQNKDIHQPQKTLAPVTPRFVSSKRECLHHFGYLCTHPKNTPIPDECFGCQRVVDCLTPAKSKEFLRNFASSQRRNNHKHSRNRRSHRGHRSHRR